MTSKHGGGRPADPNAAVPQHARIRPSTKSKLEQISRKQQIPAATLARMAIEMLVGERKLGDFTIEAA